MPVELLVPVVIFFVFGAVLAAVLGNIGISRINEGNK
jgi:hypothetical protein